MTADRTDPQSGIRKHLNEYGGFFVICFVFGLFVLLSFPHLRNNDYWAPDADRISMDGVFLHDWIRDLPRSLLNPYEYATEYYARYPALSLGYRPAFFPLIEALFYLAFGISHSSAKTAVLFFLFLGFIFWYLLVRDTHSRRVALLSLLLWATTPFIYKYSQHIMLEIPTLSMSIISVFFKSGKVCRF